MAVSDFQIGNWKLSVIGFWVHFFPMLNGDSNRMVTKKDIALDREF